MLLPGRQIKQWGLSSSSALIFQAFSLSPAQHLFPVGYTNHTEQHPAPKTGWNEHTSDFFPDKATPTSQMISLLLSTEIFSPFSQTLPFSLQAMPDQPKETKTFTSRCGASLRLLWCRGRDELAVCVGMLQAVCPRVPGQAFNCWSVPAPGGGSQWHHRAALLRLEVSPGTGLPHFLWPLP